MKTGPRMLVSLIYALITLASPTSVDVFESFSSFGSSVELSSLEACSWGCIVSKVMNSSDCGHLYDILLPLCEELVGEALLVLVRGQRLG